MMVLKASIHSIASVQLFFSQQADTEDLFERFHDCLLLQIFNMVGDIKSLGTCSVVCKRFRSLIYLVENVTIKVDNVISVNESSPDVLGNDYSMRFIVDIITKPFQMVQQMFRAKKAKVLDHSPCDILRNFIAIKHLRIEIPGGELGAGDGVLVKWKAEFGSTLDSCVVLGASEVMDNDKMFSRVEDDKEGSEIPESFCTDGSLKRRIVWTVSSLLAASVRHYFLQKIISEHPTLVRLVLRDAKEQGFLYMGKQQLEEFRRRPLMVSASAARTLVPALSMKLWYAPYLQLPGGIMLKGATLMAIGRGDNQVPRDIDGFICGAFSEPLKTAASMLVKRRYYLLDMNSF